MLSEKIYTLLYSTPGDPSIPLETGQSSTSNILTTLGRSSMYKDGVLVKQQILCLMINGHDNRMIAYVTDPIFSAD